jgi:FMN phosphatase YigB (HAD superfamily)
MNQLERIFNYCRFFPIWLLRFARFTKPMGCISFDFWDTLCSRTLSAKKIRHLTAESLIREFNFGISAENLLKIHSEISYGLSKLAKSIGDDFEYKLEVCWLYTASLFFDNHQMNLEIAKRAISTEIDLSIQHSYMHPLTRSLLHKMTQSNQLEILILSDFEGDDSFIGQILNSHVPEIANGAKIYCSSSILRSKSTGRSFQYIHSIFPNYNFHIGDNLKSDVSSPRNMGLVSMWALTPQVFLNLFRISWNRYHSYFLRNTVLSLKYEDELNTIRNLLYNWKATTTTILSPDTDLFFIGSEGAFLSFGFVDLIGSINSMTCLNFGRKVALSAAFSSYPIQVISRMLLEHFDATNLVNFFEIESAIVVSTDVIYGNLDELFTLANSKIGWSAEFAKEIGPILNSKKVLLIDIGYRGTFAYCCNLLREKKETFQYSQIFVDSTFRSFFPTNWIADFQDQNNTPYAYVLNKKLIEVIFALGPRAPYSKGVFDDSVWERQNKIIVTSHILIRFMTRPSQVMQSILDKRSIDDDLKLSSTRRYPH